MKMNIKNFEVLAKPQKLEDVPSKTKINIFWFRATARSAFALNLYASTCQAA